MKVNAKLLRRTRKEGFDGIAHLSDEELDALMEWYDDLAWKLFMVPDYILAYKDAYVKYILLESEKKERNKPEYVQLL